MKDLHVARLPADHPDAAALLEAYLAEIASRLGGFDPGRSVSADPSEMAPPRGVFLVLYEEGRAVACGGLKTLEPGHDGGRAPMSPGPAGVAEIKRMFVARDARGRGHGRRILAALEEEAHALGLRRIVLDTAAPLTEAEALYLSAGYRRVAPYNDNPYATAWFAKGD